MRLIWRVYVVTYKCCNDCWSKVISLNRLRASSLQKQRLDNCTSVECERCGPDAFLQQMVPLLVYGDIAD